MRYIFGPDGQLALRRFASSNALLAFDFDGTLAPMTTNPSAAKLRQTTRLALGRLAARYPTVIITGRARRDAIRRVTGLGLQGVAGNHGLEPWDTTEEYERQVRLWHRLLGVALTPIRGVWIEDKRFSLAIHYRGIAHEPRALAAIERAILTLGPVRVIGGKKVVNLLPEGAANKGVALERWRSQLKCDRAVYVGDDETDEDVFALSTPERVLTIRVGRSARSRASYFIRDQHETDRLLNVLAALRPDQASSGTGSGAYSSKRRRGRS